MAGCLVQSQGDGERRAEWPDLAVCVDHREHTALAHDLRRRLALVEKPRLKAEFRHAVRRLAAQLPGQEVLHHQSGFLFGDTGGMARRCHQRPQFLDRHAHDYRRPLWVWAEGASGEVPSALR
jgi:hypothetical protein